MSAGVPELTVPLGFTERSRQLNGKQFAAAVAGASEEIDLDPDALYDGVDVVLTASCSGISSGTLRVENPFSLIREISLLCAGDYVMRLSGYEAYLLAQIQRGRQGTIPYDRLAANNGTLTSGKATIPLDFTFLGIAPAHFGAIPSRFLTSFKLRIDWVTSLADGFVSNAGGSPVVSCTVSVLKRLLLEPDPAASGYGSRVLNNQPFQISSTATAFPLRGIEAGARYAGFLIVSRTGTYAELSDAAGVTGNVTVYLDATNRRDNQSFTDLREQTRSFFPENYPGTSTRFDLTGVLYVDSARFAAAGGARDVIQSLGQCLDATQAREVRLECDVTAGTSTLVRVIPVRVQSVEQTAGKWKLPVQ